MGLIDTLKCKGAALPLAVVRVIIGFMLLWAFIDKLFGLGLATKVGQGWINGYSPTHGFLLYNDGLFAPIFNALADFSAITDVVMMAGMLLIGGALILGIGMKIATLAGSLLFFGFYLAVCPPTTNPIFDYHIVYIFALIAVYMADAGDCYGLGKWWKGQSIVKRFPILE